MKIGDRVRVIGIPPGIVEGEMLTRTVFEKCLGCEFVIEGFDAYGAIELVVGEVTGSEFETIWIEPESVELLR